VLKITIAQALYTRRVVEDGEGLDARASSS